MIPNPILKVLSSIRGNEVQALLMGGQACVLYGAAEFSRDADFAILLDPPNLERFNRVLAQLQAECIAVPPFEADYLHRGHAVHFRCQLPEVKGMRIDLMAKMRGVDPFEMIWERRTTVSLPDGLRVDLLALPDLVKAKKTQRDKDWPMIRRLLEAHYFSYRDNPSPEQVDFWLQELRTPELISEAVARYPVQARRAAGARPVIALANSGAPSAELAVALRLEEDEERARDQTYWQPLLRELSRLRHQA